MKSDSVEQLVITAKFIGANPTPEVIGEGTMEYKCNYFLGNDPTKWHTDVPNYEAITLKDIYPGIDLRYSGDGTGQAAYEFVVAPGADIAQIKVEYEGADETSVDADGRLIMKTKWGEMIAAIKSPANDVLSGTASFSQLPAKTIGLEANGASRLALRTLGVTLVYSTYLGGSSDDYSYSIAVDGAGYSYVTGRTFSNNFPTQTPYQESHGGGQRDAFVTKLSSAGNTLVYSTYLGGSDIDEGFGIVVDGVGCAYVTGRTFSNNFPVQTPYQGSHGGGQRDVFVTKLSGAGNALYSTYLGGTSEDEGFAIAVDGSGGAYVTGITNSPDFPTQNPFQTYQANWDVFVTKLTIAADALVLRCRNCGYMFSEAFCMAPSTNYFTLLGLAELLRKPVSEN